MFNLVKGCALIILFAVAGVAFSQPQIYFLPANYDGTTALSNIAGTDNFAPICSGTPALEGLDLVRAYVGASTCSGTSASERLRRIPEFVLLVNDSVQLSTYLVDMLRAQEALTTINGRSIVSTKTLEFSIGGTSGTIRILVVGEQAYRNLAEERWFAAVDSAPTGNPLAGSPSSSSGGVINRVSWNTFRSSPQYNQFLTVLRTMIPNEDPNDDNGWIYWSNIHRSNCPHNNDYFLAWHRGYLYHFEKKIQQLSNNPDFRLPYWDYYSDPGMPAEFTTNSANNPLYVRGRTNTNVQPALTLLPFDSNHTRFQFGLSNAFESTLEQRPHNPVHSIIGAPWMQNFQSPRDPIFWVHHANIDRLWSAWVAAGNGRSMPAQSDSYWSGSLPDSRSYSGVNFKFGSTLTLERVKTSNPRQYLAYDYDDTRMPTTIPPAAPVRPTQRPTGASLSTGSSDTAFALNEQSVTLPITVPASIVTSFNSIRSSGQEISDLNLAVVLANVQLTELGQQAGFDYFLYLNLPLRGSSQSSESNHFIGTIGPFEINSMAHEHEGHGGARPSDFVIRIPTTVLQEAITDPSEVELSFIRVNGENSPRGQVITIQGVRIINQNQSSDFPNS